MARPQGRSRAPAPPATAEVSSTLQALGLTGYAARTFCGLLDIGEGTAADLVLRTGIPDSKVYYALEELLDRGLLEAQGGKPKRFRLADPAHAVAGLSRGLEEKQAREAASVQRVAALMETSRKKGKAPAQEELAYVVKGKENVVARAQRMIEGSKREVTLLCAEASVLSRLAGSLEDAAQRRVRLRLAVPSAPLPASVFKAAEVREIVCDCTTLVVDGSQILTVHCGGGEILYAIHSADPTLVRFGLDFYDSPRCCQVPIRVR